METPGSGYHAIIDGYNVIKQDAALAELPLEAGRARLIALLGTTRWPVPVERVDLVFDAGGQPDPLGSVEVSGRGLRVVYAVPDADSVIQRLIRTSRRPERLLIVSNDRAIRDTARSHSAACYAASWLVAHSRAKAGGAPRGAEATGITQSEARKITDELARRWGVEKPRRD